MASVMRELWHSMPYSVKAPFYVKHRSSYWKESGCIFVHVPKAAGTTVSHALYGRSLGHIKARDIKRYARKVYDSTYTFGLVRNPWDRMVSAYHFALQGGTETAGIRKPEQYMIEEFKSFEVFLYEWLSKRNVDSLDPIFQRQVSYLCDGDGVIVDHVGKVEDFESEMKVLARKIQRSIDIKSMNKSKREKGYRDYYKTKDMIDMVESIYREDVSLFGYEF